MKGVALTSFGKVSVLRVARELVMPSAKANEILVKVHATAVNRGDIMQRKGHYPPPPGASEILGMEAAGVVAEVGPGATRWAVGDRVMCLLSGGGYAEYVAADAGSCMPIPEGMSYTDAAAIPEVFLTAFQAMRLNANVQRGDTVLVHAGASGVGTAACQLCRLFGVTSVTTSSEGKLDDCRRFADHAVSRTRDVESGKQFAPKVLAALGGAKVNLVIDPVFGGGYLEEDAEVLALDGKVVVLAFMGGSQLEKLNAVPFFRKRAEIKFSTLRSQSVEYKARLVSEFSAAALGAFATGALRPVVQQVLPIEDVAAAHTLVEDNATVGKVVMTLQ